MNFFNNKAEFVKGIEKPNTKHLLIIATHQDDAEFMGYGVIAKAYKSKEYSVDVIIVSDGAGSPRTGAYANYTDEMMMEARYEEQKRAAKIGQYSSLTLLKYPSSTIKAQDPHIMEDLVKLIEMIKPETIYLHNPFDKHATHVACCLAALKAIDALKDKSYIKDVFGCEVWRGLDWVVTKDKVFMDTYLHQDELLPILSVFESQIAGGKRYDTALMGRWAANATFNDSHAVDDYTNCSYMINMNDVALNKMPITDFVNKYLNNFKEEVFKYIDSYK
jgi:LmbE family N-acetylglucosaminyl deacetylase